MYEYVISIDFLTNHYEYLNKNQINPSISQIINDSSFNNGKREC